MQIGGPPQKQSPVKLNVLRGSVDGFAGLPGRRITRPGLEDKRKNTGQTAVSKMPGPTGGPIGPDLQTVVDAWPELTEATRRKILRTVRQNGGGK